MNEPDALEPNAKAPPPEIKVEPKELKQPEYWKKDLFWKRTTIFISTLGFGAVVCSVIMNTRQLALNNQQLQLNYQAATNAELNLKNNTQQSMTKLTMDLDRVIIDHPELRQYIEGNANPICDPTNYDRAVETAIMTFDVFDVALAQVGTFKKEWSDPSGWTNWVAEDFARSPFLREQYLKYTNWYSANLTDLEVNSKKLTNDYVEYAETKKTAMVIKQKH